jgi:3-oxoacyl-[acyl-carrier-protein] synthase II
MRRRVKITGIGPVTPAGIGREEFFRGINESISRVRPITRFDPEAGAFVGAEVQNFDLKKYAPDEVTKRMPRHTQFGLAAAILALRDAGLDRKDLAGRNPIVVTGTTLMDCEGLERAIGLVAKKGPKLGQPNVLSQILSVAAADRIAQYLETPARVMTLQTACCAGLDAVGQGAEYIATGQTDFVFCGGTEAPLFYHPMLEFGLADMAPKTAELPEKCCRPFDLWRSTGVIGEGACMFVLEPEESPRKGYAFVSGYAHANDQTGQLGSGWYESVQGALANGRHQKKAIDYISAWGPGHRIIDFKEAQSLKKVFGETLDRVPTSSIKGAVGSALAAAGAIQVGSAALTMQRGVIPPTVNWETPDPDCPLALSNSPRRMEVKTILVNSHGISGSNSSLVLDRE